MGSEYYDEKKGTKDGQLKIRIRSTRKYAKHRQKKNSKKTTYGDLLGSWVGSGVGCSVGDLVGDLVGGGVGPHSPALQSLHQAHPSDEKLALQHSSRVAYGCFPGLSLEHIFLTLSRYHWRCSHVVGAGVEDVGLGVLFGDFVGELVGALVGDRVSPFLVGEPVGETVGGKKTTQLPSPKLSMQQEYLVQ